MIYLDLLLLFVEHAPGLFGLLQENSNVTHCSVIVIQSLVITYLSLKAKKE